MSNANVNVSVDLGFTKSPKASGTARPMSAAKSSSLKSLIRDWETKSAEQKRSGVNPVSPLASEYKGIPFSRVK